MWTSLIKRMRSNLFLTLVAGLLLGMGISPIAMAKGSVSRRDSCTTVVAEELVKEGAASQLPVREARNQPLEWCFAFAAADLFSMKLGRQVSATAIAASYFSDASVIQNREGSVGKVFRNLSDDLSLLFASGSTERELGQIDRVLDHVLDEGFVCTEGSVPSEFQSSAHDQDLKIKEYLDSLRRIEESYSNFEDLFEEGDGNCIQSETKNAVTKLLPRLDLETIAELTEEVEKADFHRLLTRHACEVIALPKEIQTMKLRHLDLTQRKDALSARAGQAGIDALDKQLSRRNPVVIAYSSVGLYSPVFSYRRRASNPSLDHLEVSSRIDHASIVIGRRWSDAKGGQCLYQIKNSFGKDCSKYSSEHECKDGVLWVRESHLRDMIGELSWLE